MTSAKPSAVRVVRMVWVEKSLKRMTIYIVNIYIFILIPLITLITLRASSESLSRLLGGLRGEKGEKGYKSFSLGNKRFLGKVITPYHPDHYLRSSLCWLAPCRQCA